jgi:hypothetical protein
MIFHVVITDIKGLSRLIDVVAENALDAGVIAQEKYQETLEQETDKEEKEE